MAARQDIVNRSMVSRVENCESMLKEILQHLRGEVQQEHSPAEQGHQEPVNPSAGFHPMKFSTYLNWRQGKKSPTHLFIDWFRLSLESGYQADATSENKIRTAFSRHKRAVAYLLRFCHSHPRPRPVRPDQSAQWSSNLAVTAAAAVERVRAHFDMEDEQQVTYTFLYNKRDVIEPMPLPDDTPADSTFRPENQKATGKRKGQSNGESGMTDV